MARPPANLRIKSDNGDLFIVKKDGRNLALGLIARGGKKIAKLVYFFPTNIYDAANDKSNLHLHHSQAIWVVEVSSLKIEDGSWPLVGKLKDFSFERWPMPLFWRHSSSVNVDYIDQYDEKDITKSLNSWYLLRLPSDLDVSFVVEQGLAGCEYAEDYLEKILAGKRPSNPWINVRAKQLH
jgi:hypothetical protein